MPDHVDRIVQGWRRERPDLDLAALVLLAALRRAGEPYALKPTQLMQTMLLSSGR